VLRTCSGLVERRPRREVVFERRPRREVVYRTKFPVNLPSYDEGLSKKLGSTSFFKLCENVVSCPGEPCRLFWLVV